MTDQQYRDLLDLMMVSDPWPLSEAADESLKDLVDNEARKRGWDSWIVAYHEHMKVAK